MSRPKVSSSDSRRNCMIRLKVEFGGRCALCGYDANYACLDFHHIDPKVKSFGVNTVSISSFGYKKCQAEAAKCVLLCRNCHTDQHFPGMRKDVLDRDSALWIDGLREAMNVTPPPPVLSDQEKERQYQLRMAFDTEFRDAEIAKMYLNYI